MIQLSLLSICGTNFHCYRLSINESKFDQTVSLHCSGNTVTLLASFFFFKKKKKKKLLINIFTYKKKKKNNNTLQKKKKKEKVMDSNNVSESKDDLEKKKNGLDVNVKELDAWIEKSFKCEHLPETAVAKLCSRARSMLVEEKNVQPVKCPVTVKYALPSLKHT